MLLAILFSLSVSAQNLTQEARYVLIDKLEGVLLRLAPSDTQRISVGLRLADILSEAARAEAYKENERGCFECKESENLRKKSLRYYEEFFPKLDGQQRINVMLQMGHLYQMLGLSEKSVKLLEQIVSERPSPKATADAQSTLGEIYFKRRNFTLARSYFEKAVSIPNVNQKGLIYYRIGWCQFNEGSLSSAIDTLVKVLKDPQLLSRQSDQVAIQIDPQFQEEVSRDLASFLSKRDGSEADVQLILSVSPEKSKLDHLFYLATELERNGKKQQSLKAFETYVSKQSQPELRLEGHIYLAQNYRESNQGDRALKELETSLQLMTQVSCGNEKRCAELKSRARKLVIDWNRAEKTKPSDNVSQAYAIFLDKFPQDSEMTIWAAEVAKLQNHNEQAIQLYLKAATLSKDNKTKETMLLNAVSISETSKNTKLQKDTYTAYIAAFPTGSRATDVAYQSAYMKYEEGRHEEAALAFRQIALTKNDKARDIRLKSANLSLDAMVLAKKQDVLIPWANEYATLFPESATEFRAVARKTALTRVAERINAAHGVEDYTAARTQLLAINMTGALESEKMSYTKNRLILAEKLKHFTEGRRVSDELLALPTVKPDDQQYAYSRKTYFSEMILDFSAALTSAQKMKVPDSESESHTLRMGIFAELSDQESSGYYDQVIKLTKDEAQAKALVLKLVKRSDYKIAVIQKYQNILEKDPVLLGDLYLNAYAKTEDPKILQSILKIDKLKATPGSLALLRLQYLKEYQDLKAKVITTPLESKNDRTLSAKIKERVKFIEKLEQAAARAIQSTDWTSQVVLLSLVSKETSRFYQDLFSLPIPQGLSPEEEQQYMQLLSQQSAPFKAKADDVAAKLTEMWGKANLTSLSNDFEAATIEVKKLISREVDILKEVAPEALQSSLQQVTQEKVVAKAPTNFKLLEDARQAVRESPMAPDRIQKLIGLEKEIGRDTMAAYLEGRLTQVGGVQ